MEYKNKHLESMGGVIKKDKNGNLIVAFGSTDINQEKIAYLSTLKDITGLLFYYCDFYEVDLTILSHMDIQNLSILHGNFSDNELNQLMKLKSLELVKLHDTKVSNNLLNKLKLANPNMTFL